MNSGPGGPGETIIGSGPDGLTCGGPVVMPGI